MITNGPARPRWHENRDVMWGEFDAGGQHYSIAGAPRGLPLWTEGNPEGGIADFLFWLPYSIIVQVCARNYVVKVRRHHGATRFRGTYMRRTFPRTQELADCMNTVRREVEAADS